MSLVKKSDDDSKVVLKGETDSNKPKRFVKVLDEETFITKLDNIIEKSFFPDLERLKVQKAYVEAAKSNNLDALRELYAKYSKILTPNTKNAAKETPNLAATKEDELPYANEELKSITLRSSSNNNNKSNKEETPVESLDEFLSKNTSEDNVSFEMLINDAAKKQRAKPHQMWLYEKEEKYRQLKDKDTIEAIEDANPLEMGARKADEVSKALDMWTYTSKNSLMFVPDGVALTPEEELKQAKSVRKINYANTRINPREVFANSLGAKSAEVAAKQQQQQQQSNIIINKITKIGIDGKSSDVKETPKIGGYSLVTMTPSPMPGRSLGDESPAMVWGEIESTPFRLDPSMTPYTDSGPEFKMPSVPEREKIALNLEEKASNERRKRKDEAMRVFQRVLMPSPRVHQTGTSSSSSSSSAAASPSPSINDRLSSMSPAARRLLEAKLNIRSGTPGTSAGGGTPRNAAAALTPSPISGGRFSAASPSPRVSSGGGGSGPGVKISSQSIESLKSTLKRPYSSVAAASSSDSLTDDLLKLPKNT